MDHPRAKDDVQNKKNVSLDCTFLELLSFEIERIRFCAVDVSAVA